jgi:2-polyprenyl-6-hydroxyphenyl methylase/3-demethylubiquinone-9 3-methyltransferase
MNVEYTCYGWKDADPTCAHDYILPAVIGQVRELYNRKTAKILDIGCGNGYVAAKLAGLGHSVMAIDASPDGVDIARSTFPGVQFEVGSVYDESLHDLVGTLVDCVVSLEVVEHLFYPKRLFEQSHKVLRPGGVLIVSTPYHGYLKNLAISLVNGWDRHFMVEWDGGHIKFFSKRTLARMACNAGFRNPRFQGVGRFPGMWKSMIMVVEK